MASSNSDKEKLIDDLIERNFNNKSIILYDISIQEKISVYNN